MIVLGSHGKNKKILHYLSLRATIFTGIVGLAMACAGFGEIATGANKFERELDNLTGVKFEFVNQYIVVVLATVVSIDFVVVISGFREKYRIRYGRCHHVRCCGVPDVFKGLFKGSVTLFLVGSFLFALAALLCSQFVYSFFIASGVVCGGSEAAISAADSLIDEVLDSLGYNVTSILGVIESEIGDVCNDVNKLSFGAWGVWIGSILLLIGQFITFAYWFKYTTLSLVEPFYPDTPLLRTKSQQGIELHRPEAPVHPSEINPPRQSISADRAPNPFDFGDRDQESPRQM